MSLPKAELDRLQSQRQRLMVESAHQQNMHREQLAQAQRKDAIRTTNEQIRKQIEDKDKIREMEKQMSAIERD